MRLAILLGALVLLAAALAGGANLYFSRQFTPEEVPPTVVAAEQALTTRDTAALLHFDVAAAVRAERLLLGDEDREALLGPIPGSDPLIGQLAAAGVNLRDSLEHMLIVVTVSEDRVAWAALFTGRFPVNTVQSVLEANLQTEPAPDGMILVRRENQETCTLSDPVLLSLSEDRILLGDPALVTQVLARLSEGAPAGIDLGHWRHYRQGRVFSLALLAPPMAAAELIDDPAAKFARQAADDSLDPVERLYFGARIETLPPALVLDARIEANEPAWPAQMVRAYDAWHDRFDQRVKDRLPALSRLQRHATVVAEDNSLVVEAALGEAVAEDLAALPGELIRLAFAEMGAESTTAPSTPPPEQTLEPDQVVAYQASLAPGDLAPYDSELDSSFQAEDQVGPFGVRLKALRLFEQDDSVIELEVAVASSAIANMAQDTMNQGSGVSRARVVVNEVLDQEGRNLLRTETCGADRNDQAGALQPTQKQSYQDGSFVAVPVVQGTKTVRLRPGTSLTDLGALIGVVELDLPTRVETLRLPVPPAGQVIERDGVRVSFAESEPNEIKYEISGQADRVLAVRALNRDGAYLAPAGSYASGRLLGPGRTVARSFQGTPVAFEVALASGETVVRYPFRLEALAPRFTEWGTTATYAVTTGQLDQLTVQAPTFGEQDCRGTTSGDHALPFRLCLETLEHYWSNTAGASGRLLAPNSPMLMGNLSGLELAIDQLVVEGAEGDTSVPAEVRHFFELTPRGEQLQTWFNTHFEVADAGALEGATLKGFDGRLVLRLPLELDSLTLDLSELGNEVSAAPWAVRFLGVDDGVLKLDLTGQRDRLVQLIPRDREGTALAVSQVNLEPGDEEGHWRVSLRPAGVPANLDILFASRQQEETYPLALTAPE